MSDETTTRRRGRLPQDMPVSPGGRVYSREETQAQMDLVEALLAQAGGTEEWCAQQLRAQWDKRTGTRMTYLRCRRLVRLVLDAWALRRQDPRAVDDARTQAIARCRKTLQDARGIPKVAADATGELRQVGWLTKPNFAAVAQMEHLLMRLQGTDTPVKLDLNVRLSASLDGVIANLTPAQVERFRARHREMQRLADLARARLPECVDVGAEPADDGAA